MKKIAKSVAVMVSKRDRETGLSVWDVLKVLPAIAAAIFLLVVLTRWIGFSAAFAITMITGMAVMAGYCFYIGE